MEDFEKSMQKLCFVFAVLGLILVYVFSPQNIYVQKTVKQVEQDCIGPVKFTTELKKVFYSSKGSLIGMTKTEETVFIFLKDYPVLGDEEIYVEGKANEHRGQCWIFPDFLEVIK